MYRIAFLLKLTTNLLLLMQDLIYYAGQRNLKVITNSEEPVGISVTARIPGLNLIIDVILPILSDTYAL